MDLCGFARDGVLDQGPVGGWRNDWWLLLPTSSSLSLLGRQLLRQLPVCNDLRIHLLAWT